MKYKCPFNYIGSKSGLIDVINPLLNMYSNYTLVDLFAGGFSIGANAPNKKVVYNDINKDLTRLIKLLYMEDIEDIVYKLERIIFDYKLSKENKEGYNKLRDDFNETKNVYLFCLLIFHSFNHQIRYNQQGEFNVPFGKGRSSYNNNIKKKLLNFSELIKGKEIEFYSINFKDLQEREDNIIYYVDPPYLITTGSYNDGKRGVSSWTEEDEIELYAFLSKVDKNGRKFVLSNMLQKGDVRNAILANWMSNFSVEVVNVEYRNYQRKKVECVEIIVKNF